MRPSFTRVLGVLWLGSQVGCSAAPQALARDLASATPPAAIRSTLVALQDRENQRLVLELMRNPELREATRTLSSDLADGALRAMTEHERSARIEALSERYVASLTRAVTRNLAAGMRADLAPALSAVLRESVSSALREALSVEHRRGLEEALGGATRAAVDAASRSAAEGFSRDLEPALERALRQGGPTSTSLASTTRALAREAVLGSNDAMSQVQRQQERADRPSFLGRITSLTEDGVKILRMGMLAVAVLALSLGGWVLGRSLRGRRSRGDGARERERGGALEAPPGAARSEG